jgi:hypothetical protein
LRGIIDEIKKCSESALALAADTKIYKDDAVKRWERRSLEREAARLPGLQEVKAEIEDKIASL